MTDRLPKKSTSQFPESENTLHEQRGTEVTNGIKIVKQLTTQ
jgi:hypothetical protein